MGATMTDAPEPPQPEEEVELNIGPYGLRGEHTPPLANMFGGYAMIFVGLIVLPFLLFLLVRFVIL
jgi:hypothetical protein